MRENKLDQIIAELSQRGSVSVHEKDKDTADMIAKTWNNEVKMNTAKVTGREGLWQVVITGG